MSGFPVDPGDDPEADERAFGLPERFRLNVASSYVRTGTTAIISLGLTPFLITSLGTDAFGIWIVSRLADLVSRGILEFGFAAATTKYVAEYKALGEHERLRGSIATSFWLLAALGVIAFVLGLGFAALFPDLFNISESLRESSQLLVVIVAVDLAVAIPGDAFSAGAGRAPTLRPDEWNLRGHWRRAGDRDCDRADRRRGPRTAWTRNRLDQPHRSTVAVPTDEASDPRAQPLAPSHRSTIPEAVRGLSAWLGVGQVSFLVLNRVDTMIVGAVVGVAAAGIYSVGQKLAQTIGQLSQPVAEVFYPHSSKLTAQRDHAGLRHSLVTERASSWPSPRRLALRSPCSRSPDRILVGTGFEEAATVVAFLAGTVAIWAVTNTGIAILMGSRKGTRARLIRAGEAVLNFALSITLASLIGLQGVALATLIAAAVANLGLLLPYVCRTTGVGLASFAGRLLLAHLPAAAGSLAVGLALARAIPATIPAVLAAAVLVLCTYVAILAMTGMQRAERRALLAPIRAVWARRNGRHA